MKIEGKVLELIKEIVTTQGINIDSITYEKENNIYYLRIIIDKEPYVDIDDCVNITKIINPILDESKVIEDSYVLDVCSKEKGGNE